MKKPIFLALSGMVILACQPSPPNAPVAKIEAPVESSNAPTDSTVAPVQVPTTETRPAAEAPPVVKQPEAKTTKPLAAKSARSAAAPPENGYADKGFSDVVGLDPSIRLDIRYATANNFTKAKIYDCPACLLRPEAAEAIVKAHQTLKKRGLGLKMFDCYRPRPYQQRLWDKVPNADYVTPPAKGSMHSRGAAVDLTIVDAAGKELEMGTPYDFFGEEAHTDHTKHPEKVLANRKLLRETLEAVGFKGIRTEWWHFSYQGKDYPLSDYVWPCQ